MNDPLRDNRIFPEEMQQQQKPTPKKKPPTMILISLLVLIVVLALGYFAFQKYQSPSQNSQNTDEAARYQQEKAAFDTITKNKTELTPQERSEKINTLFENNAASK